MMGILTPQLELIAKFIYLWVVLPTMNGGYQQDIILVGRYKYVKFT